VLEILKNDLTYPRVPVLVLTARHATNDVKRAIALGAKDFLSKPFTEGQLTARIERLMRHRIRA